jgi:hypothetical protein
MCLYSQQRSPLIAKQEISVYKILVVFQKDKIAISPYRNFMYGFNVVITDTAEECVKPAPYDYFEITSGFLHSYLTKEAVLEEVKTLSSKLKKSSLQGYQLKVYKAIIPVGTSYYLGQRCDICSKSLMILQ